MDFIFKQSTTLEFFQLLPTDWRNSIVPFWNDYADTSRIYILYHKNKLIAGGITFNTCSPDMLYDESEAKKWFDQNFIYLGFIWVIEEYRNKKIGSMWLRELIKKYPTQKFWLTVDEENLISFYKKNGFELIKTLKNDDDNEWLLTYQPA